MLTDKSLPANAGFPVSGLSGSGGLRWRWPLKRIPVLHAAVAALLVIIVGVPLGILLLTSVRPGTTLPFDDTPLVLSNYRDVFGRVSTYRLLGGTMLYAAASTAIGVGIAASIAFLVERTNLPLRNTIHSLMLACLALPGLIITFGWVLLLDPRIGLLNIELRKLPWVQASKGPLDIYSVWGMIMVTGLALAPTFFLMLTSLMRRMDGALEEAGQMSGASTVGVMRRVTLPLMTPGFASVMVYGALILIQAFEVPLALGVTAGFPVLSLSIYISAQSDMELPHYGLAAVFGILATIIGIGLMMLYYRVVRVASRFQVIGGKGYRPRRLTLDRAKWPALAGVGLYVALGVALPLLMLLWATLVPSNYYEHPSLNLFSSLNLQSYARLFAYPKFFDAIVNTVIVVIVTSTTTTLLATLVAWLSVRSGAVMGKFLDMTAFSSLAIPGIVSTLAIMMIFVSTPIYGTIWILIAGMLVGGLGFVTRLMVAAVTQISRELEEAAQMCGARPLRTFRSIVLPLLRPAFVNGWLWVASHHMRNFTVPLMLASTQNVVIASLLWQLWSRGNGGSSISIAAALAVLMVIALLLMSALLRGYSERLETRAVG